MNLSVSSHLNLLGLRSFRAISRCCSCSHRKCFNITRPERIFMKMALDKVGSSRSGNIVVNIIAELKPVFKKNITNELKPVFSKNVTDVIKSTPMIKTLILPSVNLFLILWG